MHDSQASKVTSEEKRFMSALEEMEEMSAQLSYVQGQRDGMMSIVMMVLLSAIAIALIRRFYGPTN